MWTRDERGNIDLSKMPASICVTVRIRGGGKTIPVRGDYSRIDLFAQDWVHISLHPNARIEGFSIIPATIDRDRLIDTHGRVWTGNEAALRQLPLGQELKRGELSCSEVNDYQDLAAYWWNGKISLEFLSWGEPQVSRLPKWELEQALQCLEPMRQRSVNRPIVVTTR